MNPKAFLLLEKGARVSMDDWNELKDYIFKLYLRIEDLEKSRESWKTKYQKLKSPSS